MFEGKCGIMAVHFFRKTGNRSNKGRCITRITVFICGVLCVHFPWAYQSPRKKSHRGTAFSHTEAGLEGMRCAEERRERERMKHSGVVKSVLYAVVVSAWASVVISIENSFDIGLMELMEKYLINPKSYYSIESFHDAACEFFSKAFAYNISVLSFGVFVFLTLYFCDEWKYTSENYRDYLREPVALQCVCWSLFLFQVCLIESAPIISSFCGIIAVLIITGNLYKGRREYCVYRFIIENIVWMISLSVFVILLWINEGLYQKYAIFPPLSSIIIVCMRMFCKCGLPPKSHAKVFLV